MPTDFENSDKNLLAGQGSCGCGHQQRDTRLEDFNEHAECGCGHQHTTDNQDFRTEPFTEHAGCGCTHEQCACGKHEAAKEQLEPFTNKVD